MDSNQVGMMATDQREMTDLRVCVCACVRVCETERQRDRETENAIVQLHLIIASVCILA